MELRLTNQVAYRGGGRHDLQGGDAAAVFLLDQGLRHDPFDGFGELRADLRLLIGWKYVDDTVNGFVRARRVQCSEDQMAGFRGSQRQLNRIEVPHFSDQNDVRIFAQRGLQRIGKGVSMRSQFALVDEAFFRFVNELDRIFDRQNMAFICFVEIIDHGGEGRGFA